MMLAMHSLPQLVGLGAGNSSVMALQQALKDLAVAANYPIADPGTVDGYVGAKTVGALVSWLSKIPKVPSPVKTALNLIGGAGFALLQQMSPTVAKEVTDVIAKYASDLTIGVQGLLVLYGGGGNGAPPAPPPAANQAVQTVVTARPVFSSGSNAAYKAGSFSRFNRSRGTYSVYSPLAGSLGLAVSCAGHCLAGDCLGDGGVTPAVPPGFVKVGEEITAAAAAAKNAPVTGEEKDKSLLSSPYFWLGVGGVVIVGGGGFIYLRRKKSGGLRGSSRRRRRR